MTPTLSTLEALHAALTTAASLARQCEEQGADIGYARDHIDDAMADMGGALADEKAAEQPCSDEARSRGCSCREGSPYEYEPEPIIDRDCPLHGRDPDAARDMRMEAAE